MSVYDAEIAPTTEHLNGRRFFRFRVLETNATSASEFKLDKLPKVCTLMAYRARLYSGTGETIQPRLGFVPLFAENDVDELCAEEIAGVFVNNQETVSLFLPAGNLYVRNSPNSGEEDHLIRTDILIIEGADIA